MRPVSPPGIPNTNSIPASSRTRTTACGTSISSGIMAGRYAAPGVRSSVLPPAGDLHERGSLKFGERLAPATARTQVALSICARIDVLDQRELAGRQVSRQLGRVEAERVRLTRLAHDGQRLAGPGE